MILRIIYYTVLSVLGRNIRVLIGSGFASFSLVLFSTYFFLFGFRDDRRLRFLLLGVKEA